MRQDVVTQALDRFDTPMYVFDERSFVRAFERIRSSLPEQVSLCYAMKANPFVVRWAASRVERIEACSMGEMCICQRAGIPLEKVVVSGVHKDPCFLHELVDEAEYVCRYTVESVSQYEMIERIALESGTRVPILIRLTSGNQFGLDESGVRMLLERASKSYSVYPFGIQYFSGTQKTSGERIRRELIRLDGFIRGIDQELGIRLRELEYGPGLAVEYFEHDDRAARQKEDDQLDVLGDALACMQFTGDVAVELGRALSASCGTYVTRVVDTKRSNGYNYAIVDGGMHQLAYYGHAMSLRQPPCRVVTNQPRDSKTVWSIFGSLCTTNDVLAKQLSCGDLHIGDVLAFDKAGAYCMTEGLSLFLSRDLPRVVMADLQGELSQVRGRIETWALNTD